MRLRNGVATADFRHDDLRVDLPNVRDTHPLGVVFLADSPLEHAFSSADEQNLAWLELAHPWQAATGRPVGEAKVRLESVNCQGGNTTVDVVVGGPGVGLVLADLATSTGSCGVAARARCSGDVTRDLRADRAGIHLSCGHARGRDPVRHLGEVPTTGSGSGEEAQGDGDGDLDGPGDRRVDNAGHQDHDGEGAEADRALREPGAEGKEDCSVKRGRAVPYRIVVRNTGIVTAGQVRACVTLSAGARVRTARGAQVRGRRGLLDPADTWRTGGPEPHPRPGRSEAEGEAQGGPGGRPEEVPGCAGAADRVVAREVAEAGVG